MLTALKWVSVKIYVHVFCLHFFYSRFETYFKYTPSPSIDNILAMMVVWR